MDDGRVSYSVQDGVAALGMDDGKANALSHDLIDQLMAALTRAQDEARAVLLTGRAGKFCAGFDLQTMLSGIEPARKLVAHGAELYLRLFEYGLPVVMACTGHAVAGGAVLLLCGDVRIAAAGPFRVGLNEIAIGMPLPVFVQELARERLDPRSRVAAVLHGTLYGPTDAVAVGYLDEVVAPETLEATARERARTLAKLPTEPYALTKQRMRRAMIEHVRATLAEDMARLTPPAG